MHDVPRSKIFDDIYFSIEDGRAETQHVFLDHNNLPLRFNEKDVFTICETGFGTGLNFLMAWEMYEESASAGTLHFISFEKYPLGAGEIEKYLSDICIQKLHPDRPTGESGSRCKDYKCEKVALDPDSLLRKYQDAISRFKVFIDAYPTDLNGWQPVQVAPNVKLTLVFGDMNDEISNMEADVDAWFLDGFAPAKNPDMWSDVLFENMARLSGTGTTFSTFTAAGFVKRGLQAAGFDVEKVAGFGRKREMLKGTFFK